MRAQAVTPRVPRTVEELVAAFIEIGIAQNDAIGDYDHRRFNRLFDKMILIENELQAMPGDQRRALEPLFAHPDMQVRLNAAKATLAVAPLAARALLLDIRNSGWLPQAADAAGTIRALDDGSYRPT